MQDKFEKVGNQMLCLQLETSDLVLYDVAACCVTE